MKKAIKKRGGLAPDKYHSDEDLARIFNYLRAKAAANATFRNETNLFIAELLIASGLRAQELLSLKIKDLPIYHDKPVIYVAMGKGRVARTVEIDDYTVGRIRRFVKSFRGRIRPGSHLIVNERGQVMSYQCLYLRFQTIARNSGVQFVRPHMFRHDYAMALYRVQNDLVIVSDQLGHSDVKITTIYAKTNNQERRRQVDMLGSKLGEIIRKPIENMTKHKYI